MALQPLQSHLNGLSFYDITHLYRHTHNFLATVTLSGLQTLPRNKLPISNSKVLSFLAQLRIFISPSLSTRNTSLIRQNNLTINNCGLSIFFFRLYQKTTSILKDLVSWHSVGESVTYYTIQLTDYSHPRLR